MPRWGSLVKKSQFSSTSREMPSPSEPMTSATRPSKGASQQLPSACSEAPPTQKPGSLEVIERTGDIGHLRDGQVHDGAGRSLVAADGHTGGAFVGNDDARRAHDLGGAHDGAKVTIVGHVVEHHDKCRALACAVEDIGNIGIGEIAHLERNALVSAMARQCVELRARHILNADTRGVEIVDQVRQGGIALLHPRQRART